MFISGLNNSSLESRVLFANRAQQLYAINNFYVRLISFGFLRLQLQQLQYAIFHLPFTVFLNVTNRRDFFTFFSLRFTAESFFLHSSAMKTG